ncbi:MAG: hypothetical protein CFH34_01233 [Alphaproteobacteria bacterium MarineAlpha9_Bin4]|nr:aldehyde-activating protein [Pelagibacterales bacterium]PPR25901.1 MAG: hypothetical protein CFH34_01233 [Alphaproteobacteria bacterium MarineAlpha9_Bin4]|tara:strand:+ start:290 stop:670 length:381 start_codon:yes stop_codon:yes gene_type:complete
MNRKYKGQCHCNTIRFDFFCDESVVLLECNCSICLPYRYLHLIVENEKFNLKCNANKLISYKFKTKVADHLFCMNCGIKSFYKPASHPNSVSINYYSIIKPPKIKKILLFDGKNWEQAVKDLEKSN